MVSKFQKTEVDAVVTSANFFKRLKLLITPKGLRGEGQMPVRGGVKDINKRINGLRQINFNKPVLLFCVCYQKPTFTCSLKRLEEFTELLISAMFVSLPWQGCCQGNRLRF